MGAVRETETSASVKRGAQVAKRLGWPQEQVGVMGALAALLDLGPPRRLRSTQVLLRRYEAQRAARLRRTIAEAIRETERRRLS